MSRELKESAKMLEEEFHSERLEELKKNVLSMQWIEESDIDIMKKNESYKLDPNLALAMFHCCGANPKAHVYNNESLLKDTTGAQERISNEIENNLLYEEVVGLKNDVANSLSRNKPLWMCASCNEIMFLSNSQASVCHISISDLHCNFKMCEEKVLEINENYEEEIVNKHFSIFKENDTHWYYLNPDLIASKDKITLCSVCFKDPLSHPYSIASGHDYGRLSDLPNLNFITKSTLSLVRMFGQTIHLNSKTCSGHVITFDSNGPKVCSSSMLEALDENCAPHVTFIGSREKWRVDKQKYRNLYSISAQSVFAWLDVLSEINPLYLDRKIKFESKSSIRNKISELNSCIEAAVIITNDKTINKIDEMKSGDRYGEDENVKKEDASEREMLIENYV